MKMIQEGKTTTIFPHWQGDTEWIGQDVSCIIVTPPNPAKRSVAGIRLIGFGGFSMNGRTAWELAEGLEAALEIVKKLDSEVEGGNRRIEATNA